MYPSQLPLPRTTPVDHFPPTTMSSTKTFADLKDEIAELYSKNTLPTVQSYLKNKYGFDAKYVSRFHLGHISRCIDI